MLTKIENEYLRSIKGMSEIQSPEHMTNYGKTGFNSRTYASPKFDRTRCLEE